jgi:hypothetical protein
LTIERQTIGILGDGDVGHKPGRRTGALDSLALLAGILVTDMADHLDLGGNDVELLADFFADTAELGAAGTGLLLGPISF